MNLCGFEVGLDKPFFLIAGPCVIESMELQMETAGKLKEITSELGISVGIGFAAAFILAFIVVRYALDFINRHGFAPFAYWRIFVGAIGLWGVLLFG